MKIDTRTTGLRELETRLHVFEETYGVPSSAMVSAFTVNGQVRETPELRAWSRVFRTYEAAVRAREARTA